MTETRKLVVIAFYACVAAAFLANNWLAGTQPDLVRWPDAAWVPGTAVIRAGVDRARLDHSVQRLPSIRFLRMLGNNFRILLGQRLEWILWGEQREIPVLAPKNELAVSRGLADAAVKANLDHLIKRLGQYSRKLQAEGWELYVVPVPTKLSVYREHFAWPLQDTDEINRRPIDADHGDELLAYLGRAMADGGVRFIDLQTPYRQAALAHPGQWLYPPGESHWSGRGIEIAAQTTARNIAQASRMAYVDQPTITELPIIHVGDIIRSMDAFPALMGRYRIISNYHDTLKRWPTYVPDPDNRNAADATLVAVLGTSYTGQFGWLVGEPVGFAQAIGGHLHHAAITQISQTGIGGFHPFRTFLERKEELVRDFSQRTGQPEGLVRKIVVWEFPIRDFGYLTAHSEAGVMRIENPYGTERHLERQLFWLGPAPATTDIFASEDGVVAFSADLQPGPARRPGSLSTLVITNEAGQEFRHRVIPGPNLFRIPVRAGTNRLSWRPLEPAEIPPPYANGDPRTLVLSVFDLKLGYEPGADPSTALTPIN